MNFLIKAYVSEGLDRIEKSYGETPQECNPGEPLLKCRISYFNEFYQNYE
jgi:hypothetical protein